MEVSNVTFVKSSPGLESCPKAVHPEYAFTGRSNAGKSSLINMLVNMKKLAKTSSTPGKTRLINHYLVNNKWYLVDLPGYGYAKGNNRRGNSFLPVISNYLINRTSLSCLFLLIDCRHEPLRNDLEILKWIGINEIPFALVFTKADKVNRLRLEENVDKYRTIMLHDWEGLPPFFITSSLRHRGRDEILEFIEKTNMTINS